MRGEMKMKKRVLSALLALVLVLSTATLPVMAAHSFSDISDKNTARNVEVLHLLGVVNGTGGGSFNPGGQLTRAEFCKMAVVLMGKGDDAQAYQTMTIFPDVRASHWAAGYVNLAVRQTSPKLIAGQPDGTFQPDRAITYGEAVTILMRLLGYSNEDGGGVWPDGFINLAKAKNVTKGLSLGGSAAISRAQAAQLFVNVLGAEKKEGGTYTPANCTREDKEVTLVSLNGNTLRVSGGSQTKYDLVRPSSSSALNGLKGHLLLDKDGKVLTFVPTTNSSTGTAVSNAAVIVSADKSTDGLSALAGGRTDFSVYRNGLASTVSALRRYDVVTYDASTNTVYACDTRVAVYYESCDPSPSAPNSITVLNGTEFSVLPTAQESLSGFKPGKTMILLLTSDGSVAGAVDSDSSARANAVGIVDANGKLQMFCGSTMVEISGSYSDYSGKLVSISSAKDKSVSLSAKSGGASGDLNVREGTLGGKRIASNVLVYDDGKLKSLSELTEIIIPEDQIAYVRTNSSGEIDLIAISSADGTVKYGRATVDANDKTTTITVDCGGTTYSYEAYYAVKTGDFVAFQEDGKRFTQMSAIDSIGKVSRSAWVGTTAINYGGKTYSVPSSVLIWNRDTKSWFTGDDAVKDAIAYGGTMNLYVKNGVVRAIEVIG